MLMLPPLASVTPLSTSSVFRSPPVTIEVPARPAGPEQSVEGDPVHGLRARDHQRAGQVGRVIAVNRRDHAAVDDDLADVQEVRLVGRPVGEAVGVALALGERKGADVQLGLRRRPIHDEADPAAGHLIGADGPNRLDRPSARDLPLDRRLCHLHGCPGRRRGRGGDKLCQADPEMAAIGGADDHALPAVRHFGLDRGSAREYGDAKRLRVRPRPERRLAELEGDPRLGIVQENLPGQGREQESSTRARYCRPASAETPDGPSGGPPCDLPTSETSLTSRHPREGTRHAVRPNIAFCIGAPIDPPTWNRASDRFSGSSGAAGIGSGGGSGREGRSDVAEPPRVGRQWVLDGRGAHVRPPWRAAHTFTTLLRFPCNTPCSRTRRRGSPRA